MLRGAPDERLPWLLELAALAEQKPLPLRPLAPGPPRPREARDRGSDEHLGRPMTRTRLSASQGAAKRTRRGTRSGRRGRPMTSRIQNSETATLRLVMFSQRCRAAKAAVARFVCSEPGSRGDPVRRGPSILRPSQSPDSRLRRSDHAPALPAMHKGISTYAAPSPLTQERPIQ